MSYADVVLADSPLAYWPLSETGTVAVDAGGSSRDLTFTGSYTRAVTVDWLTGTTFSGGYANRAYEAWLDSTAGADWSAEIWFRLTALASGTRHLVSRTGTNQRWSFYLSGNTIKCFHSGSGFPTVTTAADAYPLNRWNHCVFVKTATEMLLYLNGAQVGTLATVSSTPTGGTGIAIGASPEGAAPISGNLARAAVYSQALTLTRINVHYHTDNPAFAAAAFGSTATVSFVAQPDPTYAAVSFSAAASASSSAQTDPGFATVSFSSAASVSFAAEPDPTYAAVTFASTASASFTAEADPTYAAVGFTVDATLTIAASASFSAVRFGADTVTAIYLGADPVTAAYVGTDLIWSSSG